MSKDELHTLAGLQAAILQAEQQHKDGGTSTASAISPSSFSSQAELKQFYPPYLVPEATDSKPKKVSRLFKQKSVEAKHPSLHDEFEKSFAEAQEKLRKMDAYQLKVLYLQQCWHKAFYGSVMFVGHTRRPFKPIHFLANNEKLVTMALNTECVHLFSTTSPPVSVLRVLY